MRSRTGTKLYAVRDGNGKFKDIQSYKRAHAADMRHTSAAEAEARLSEVERKVQQARLSASKLFRSSMQEAVAAAKVVRSSMREAVSAVARASRNIAKEASVARQAVMPLAKTAKRPVRKAGARLAA
jgi:hypothetical protein